MESIKSDVQFNALIEYLNILYKEREELKNIYNKHMDNLFSIIKSLENMRDVYIHKNKILKEQGVE